MFTGIRSPVSPNRTRVAFANAVSLPVRFAALSYGLSCHGLALPGSHAKPSLSRTERTGRIRPPWSGHGVRDSPRACSETVLSSVPVFRDGGSDADDRRSGLRSSQGGLAFGRRTLVVALSGCWLTIVLGPLTALHRLVRQSTISGADGIERTYASANRCWLLPSSARRARRSHWRWTPFRTPGAARGLSCGR